MGGESDYTAAVDDKRMRDPTREHVAVRVGHCYSFFVASPYHEHVWHWAPGKVLRGRDLISENRSTDLVESLP